MTSAYQGTRATPERLVGRRRCGLRLAMAVRTALPRIQGALAWAEEGRRLRGRRGDAADAGRLLQRGSVGIAISSRRVAGKIEQVTGLRQVSHFCRPLSRFPRLFSGRAQPSVPRFGGGA